MHSVFTPFLFRSSLPVVFCKKITLRNFAKFTGKHLCQSLFFNKAAGLSLRPATLLKKRLWHRCFPVNLPNSQNTFLHRTPLVAAFSFFQNSFYPIKNDSIIYLS